MAAPPTKEQPILIEYVHHEDRYTYLDRGTPVERKPLRPAELWIDYDNIPPIAPVPSPFPGTVGPFTRGILDEPLFSVPGNPFQFRSAPPNHITLVVPGNLQNQAYRPTLKDATSRVIPYNPSVWVVDGVEMVVQFKYNTPAELGYTLPLTLTYWSYTGAVAGTSLALLSITNEGAGAGMVFDVTIAGTAFLRTLTPDPTAGLEGIIITTPLVPGDVIRIGNTMTGANLGAGAQVFVDKTAAAALRFRSLVAAGGSGITITQNANDITFDAAAGTVVGIANEGVGTGLIFDAVVANVANLRTLLIDPTVGNGGIAISTVGTEVRIGNTMTGANVGAGTGTVFSAKTAAGVLQFNTLAGTANGLTVSAPAANVITIDNTLTGANVGGGAGVFRNKTTNFLNLRSLIAAGGSGITITQNADDITFDAAAGSVVSIANEGAGTGLIFDAVVANVANLRTLLIDPTVGNEGIAISTVGTEVRIGNTMTGANVGAGTGTVFSVKTAAGVLQFNTLAGTANGLTVSAPAANVITIDNTLTGANVGGGAGVFRDKTTNFLNLRSLIAAGGSGITITQNANDITFAAAAGSVVSIANEGAGTGHVFDAVVANVANLRTLQADPLAANAGIAIADAGTVINIGNTLTGNNLSATVGRVDVFTTKTAGPALLNFRSLFAGANVMITADSPGVGDITIAAGVVPPTTPGTVWIVIDQKANGVNAGNFAPTLTWLTRTLNLLTSFGPAPANVTLAANQLTFQPGVYQITGSAPAHGSQIQSHQTRVWSVTAAATLLAGCSMGLTVIASNVSQFRGLLNFAVVTVVEIQHQRTGPGLATNGLGLAAGVGINEVYTSLEITQLA